MVMGRLNGKLKVRECVKCKYACNNNMLWSNRVHFSVWCAGGTDLAFRYPQAYRAQDGYK